MTAPSSINPARFLYDQLEQAGPDLLRQLLTTFIDTQMSAEADAVCGAEYGQRSEAQRVHFTGVESATPTSSVRASRASTPISQRSMSARERSRLL
jgi:transposase-like protein